MNKKIDILMITHNRAFYTNLSLSSLLETCDENMRVWVWQNGNDQDTMNVVNSYKNHPNLFKYYHSHENKKLNEPTNWLWENSDADYFSKVDDDCIVPQGWTDILRKAHEDIPKLGIIGCWHFFDEDFLPQVAMAKIQQFEGRHKIMRNCWLGGSGYLLKRECFELAGTLKNDQTFTEYCINLAKNKYIIGWYYPFVYQEHLDDPRSPNTLLKCDADIKKWAPLSAKNNGIETLEAWQEQLKKSARYLQEAPYDPKYYTGWRNILKKFNKKLEIYWHKQNNLFAKIFS